MHAFRTVDDLRDVQIDDDTRQRERMLTLEAELAFHQVEHRRHALLGREIEIFVETKRDPRVGDAGDRPLPRGKEGIVRVRTAQAADCYLGDPETSARHFRGGWFYPGDVGYLREDDLLVVTGRQETLLNVGGDKINPEIVEEVLAAFPAIADVAVLNIPNELGIEEIYALIVTNKAFDEAELRKHCAQRLQAIFIPVRFIAVEKIPRNDMAKIERGQLVKLFRSAD